jgi:hypothetical protein
MLMTSQVAYLMADISNVNPAEIKDISDSLEALSCKFPATQSLRVVLTALARILTRFLY